MKQFNKFFDLLKKSYRKLESVFIKKESTFMSAQNNSPSISLRTGQSKGGQVLRGQTVFIKSNYQVAGKSVLDKKTGLSSRATKMQIGSHASASLDYINNHGAEDIKEEGLSNVYDEQGERLSQKEFEDLKKSMKEEHDFGSFRRTVISVNQDITREDFVKLAKDIQNDFQEQTGKNYDFKIAIHTDHEVLHAHVISTGSGRDIMMTKEQLTLYKEISKSNTENILNQKDLDKDKSINKIIDKEIEKVKEKGLSKGQEIDKLIDSVLDNYDLKQNYHSLSI